MQDLTAEISLAHFLQSEESRNENTIWPTRYCNCQKYRKLSKTFLKPRNSQISLHASCAFSAFIPAPGPEDEHLSWA